MRSYTHAHSTLAAHLAQQRASSATQGSSARLHAHMRAVVATLWSHFGVLDGSPKAGVASFSWVGFYEKQPDDTMTLVCREPKPACSPIGLHGMCGKGWKDRTTYIVPDIRVLGNDYIACDPRDQSELVLPVLLPGGSCWGVLDIDSYTPSAFDDHDAREVTLMLQTAELMTLAAPIRTIV